MGFFVISATRAGRGGKKFGKFMRKKKAQNQLCWLITQRVDNNKTNKAQAVASAAPTTPAYKMEYLDFKRQNLLDELDWGREEIAWMRGDLGEDRQER